MDNDKKIVKKIKNAIKNVRFKAEYSGREILSEVDGNDLIYQMLAKDEPMAVMRLGATEAVCVYPWMLGKEPDEEILQRGMILSGIFPADSEHNAEFAETYLKALYSADIMALWDVSNEKKIVDRYCKPDVRYIRSKSIEPYYYDEPWSRILEGRKVLIVHPFVETIKSQYERRSRLFENPDVLPEFGSIRFVKAVQSSAGEKSEFGSWLEALNHMKAEIEKQDFDVAIIGAGAYALPLCAHVKSLGKQAVQMSGATQILFGIKGRRWDDHPVISKLYNEYWVRPNESETPKHNEKVEGGSYW